MRPLQSARDSSLIFLFDGGKRRTAISNLWRLECENSLLQLPEVSSSNYRIFLTATDRTTRLAKRAMV